jgi:hypothetical protein
MNWWKRLWRYLAYGERRYGNVIAGPEVVVSNPSIIGQSRITGPGANWPPYLNRSDYPLLNYVQGTVQSIPTTEIRNAWMTQDGTAFDCRTMLAMARTSMTGEVAQRWYTEVKRNNTRTAFIETNNSTDALNAHARLAIEYGCPDGQVTQAMESALRRSGGDQWTQQMDALKQHVSATKTPKSEIKPASKQEIKELEASIKAMTSGVSGAKDDSVEESAVSSLSAA